MHLLVLLSVLYIVSPVQTDSTCWEWKYRVRSSQFGPQNHILTPFRSMSARIVLMSLTAFVSWIGTWNDLVFRSVFYRMYSCNYPVILAVLFRRFLLLDICRWMSSVRRPPETNKIRWRTYALLPGDQDDSLRLYFDQPQLSQSSVLLQ